MIAGLQLSRDVADLLLDLPQSASGGKIEPGNFAAPSRLQVAKGQFEQRAFACAVGP